MKPDSVLGKLLEKRLSPKSINSKHSNFSGANELIKAAGKLKLTMRSGWIKKAGIANAESVADHSFRMAVIGMFLGEELRLDAAKVVRMCLLHDLAESFLGDIMPEEKKSEAHHRMKELKILVGILSFLPERSRKKLTGDVEELMASKTPESRAVWQIDKLEMSIQQRDYKAEGYDEKKLSQFDSRGLLSRPMRRILIMYDGVGNDKKA